MPGVVTVELEVHKGDIVPPLMDTTGRVGHIICEGATAAEAMQRCIDAHNVLVVAT